MIEATPQVAGLVLGLLVSWGAIATIVAFDYRKEARRQKKYAEDCRALAGEVIAENALLRRQSAPGQRP